MLAIETQGLQPMNWGRKGAMLMLAVVVLWTAMPAAACLLPARSAGLPDCCRGMEQGGGSPSMSADNSCCKVQHRDSATVPAFPYSANQSQKLAFVLNVADVEAPASSRAGYRNALESPPPKRSSGGSSILRI